MDTIERVARALCAADGNNPEAVLATGRMESYRESANSVGQREITVKGWTKYKAEAQRFKAAFEVMRAVEMEPMIEATEGLDDGG